MGISCALTKNRAGGNPPAVNPCRCKFCVRAHSYAYMRVYMCAGVKRRG